MDVTNPSDPSTSNNAVKVRTRALKRGRKAAVEPLVQLPPSRVSKSSLSREEVDLDLSILMDRVARGDELAFEEIYDRLSPSVFGLILRVVRDRAQSEEVAQEVMLEVWRQAPRYSSERGSVRSWILTVAHHRAVDRVRSAQASHDRDERVGRAMERPFDDVVETVERHVETAMVRTALEVLSDVQREAISLAYYQGLTQREVSDVLHVPLGTVKTRIRDGLTKLGKEMADHDTY